MLPFDVAGFQHLRKNSFGSELYYYNEVDSTNRIAESLARQPFREGLVIIANSQTSGRGRNGNQWFSPQGENLYFTLLLKPGAKYLHRLPFIAGLAVVNSLAELGLKVDLKWPNDLLVGGRKIGGILVQSAIEGEVLQYAATGIGVNVNTMQFPHPLQEVATSIKIEKNQPGQREPLMASILFEFQKFYEKMDQTSWEDFSREVEEHSSFIQNCDLTIRTHEGVITGTSAGLDPFGGLIVKTPTGQSVFYSGEVQACRKKEAHF